jgi:hypothetical protein
MKSRSGDPAGHVIDLGDRSGGYVGLAGASAGTLARDDRAA